MPAAGTLAGLLAVTDPIKSTTPAAVEPKLKERTLTLNGGTFNAASVDLGRDA